MKTEVFGWTVTRVKDPPFKNDVMVLQSPVGDERSFVRDDDSLVWEFLATILNDAQRRRGGK